MPRLLADLTPLKVSPPYRRLFLGNCLSLFGTQITVMAVSLEVFDLTKSSAAVGAIGIVALIPLIVTGLYGGAVADAFDRRKVALISSLVLWVTSLGICLHAWLDVHQLWLIYLLMGIHSGASGINQPTRGAIIPALVGKDLLPAANALNMTLGSMAMMIAPVLGGVLVATVGYPVTYSIDVVTFLASLWSVWMLPPMKPERDESAGARRIPGLKSVWDGFRFQGTRPNVRMTFLIDLCAMVLAAPRALLPAVAAFALGGKSTTVGILLAGWAIGSFLGGLFSGPLGGVRRQGLAVYLSVTGWGLCIAATGAVVFAVGSPEAGEPDTIGIVLAVVALTAAGVLDTISAVFRSTILQAATPDHLRGRLQGVFTVVVAGGPRLGEAASGAMAVGWAVLLGASSVTHGTPGEAMTLVVGGALCVVGAALLMRMTPGFLRYDAQNPTP
ncbi:MFS transporter [Galactobacter sp.]|uniref:MFS transporter n=1 Tax=Galactobacter sp. TaxID=2676125 RepID=UPI0025BCF386|nr:MFS transporter [Galactobacter sp.]